MISKKMDIKMIVKSILYVLLALVLWDTNWGPILDIGY
jgi:hypothetical protein